MFVLMLVKKVAVPGWGSCSYASLEPMLDDWMAKQLDKVTFSMWTWPLARIAGSDPKQTLSIDVHV